MSCSRATILSDERWNTSVRKCPLLNSQCDTKLKLYFSSRFNQFQARGQYSFGACTQDFRDFTDFRTELKDTRDFENFKNVQFCQGFRPDFKAFRSGFMNFSDFKSGFMDFKFLGQIPGFSRRVSGILRQIYDISDQISRTTGISGRTGIPGSIGISQQRIQGFQKFQVGFQDICTPDFRVSLPHGFRPYSFLSL